MDAEAISKRLIQLRGEKTQEENGSRIPRDEIKIRIAKYYHKSVQAIFFNNNDTKCDMRESETNTRSIR